MKNYLKLMELMKRGWICECKDHWIGIYGGGKSSFFFAEYVNKA